MHCIVVSIKLLLCKISTKILNSILSKVVDLYSQIKLKTSYISFLFQSNQFFSKVIKTVSPPKCTLLKILKYIKK